MTLLQFFNKYLDPSRPVILGISGGEDSTALFFALLEVQKHVSIDLHLVHLDHGWREESAEEAKVLLELAKKSKLPFHHTRQVSQSEDEARSHRLAFFKEVTESIGAQAVLLAHHRKDQAETVLKRLLEGGSIWNRGGMEEIATINDLTLWRPWLTMTKPQIREYLKDYTPFTDATNSDPIYLRSRLRHQILPNLSKQFGKEVENSLFSVGQELQEVKSFLNRSVWSKLILTQRASGILCEGIKPFLSEPLPLRFIVQKLCSSVHWSLSRAQLATVVKLLQANATKKRVENGHWVLWVDRGKLFLEKNKKIT